MHLPFDDLATKTDTYERRAQPKLSGLSVFISLKVGCLFWVL